MFANLTPTVRALLIANLAVFAAQIFMGPDRFAPFELWPWMTSNGPNSRNYRRTFFTTRTSPGVGAVRIASAMLGNPSISANRSRNIWSIRPVE